MSTAIAEVYFARKSCHVLRPVPIEHQFDPVIYKNARCVTSYEEFEKAAAEKDAPFPIDSQIIEGYFDASDTPAYLRMADLLEQVYKEPPRDDPFAPPFRPHFNLLKYVALLGVHILFALRLPPKKAFFFCRPLADFAQRIYGYVEKAYISPADVAAMEARIRPFVK